MFALKFTSCAAAAAIASVLSITSTHAAMSPSAPYGAPIIQHVDCAVGFHIGPAGACIVGVDNAPPPPATVIVDPPPAVAPAPPVVERRAVDEGCETRSVTQTDAAGNSETHRVTNCN